MFPHINAYNNGVWEWGCVIHFWKKKKNTTMFFNLETSDRRRLQHTLFI